MKENMPSRAQRVNEIEKVFQNQGESDRKSFASALVVDFLAEDYGVSMEHAFAFERAIRISAHKRLAYGLVNLHQKRIIEQEVAK